MARGLMIEDIELDTRGLLCPLPVIRTQDAVKNMEKGATLRVIATDPGVLPDIPAWCRIHGHKLIETTDGDTEISIRIQVS